MLHSPQLLELIYFEFSTLTSGSETVEEERLEGLTTKWEQRVVSAKWVRMNFGWILLHETLTLHVGRGSNSYLHFRPAHRGDRSKGKTLRPTADMVRCLPLSVRSGP